MPDAEEAALLAAIAEAPDDDAPRLVYGDWLLAHADAAACERGELVQVQCALARTPEASTARSVLVRRAAVLLARCERAVIEAGGGTELLELGAELAIERGLVSGVLLTPDLSIADVARPLARLFARSPVTSLHGTFEDVRALLEVPGIERVRSLGMVACSRDGVFGELCHASPALRSLRVMSRAPHDELPLSVVLASPLAGQLTELGLAWTRPRPGGWALLAASLAGSVLGKRLQSLAVDAHHLDGDMLDVLASVGLPELRSLALEGASETRFAPLVESVAFPRLEALRVGRSTWMTERIAVATLDARPRLKSFVFEGPPGVYDAAELAAHASHLTVLGLRNCRIDDRRAAELAAAGTLARLRVLDLSLNSISTQGARTLARSRYLSELHTLELRGNAGIAASPFVSATSLEGLSRLDLRDNGIRPTTSIARRLTTRFGAAVLL